MTEKELKIGVLLNDNQKDVLQAACQVFDKEVAKKHFSLKYLLNQFIELFDPSDQLFMRKPGSVIDDGEYFKAKLGHEGCVQLLVLTDPQHAVMHEPKKTTLFLRFLWGETGSKEILYEKSFLLPVV